VHPPRPLTPPPHVQGTTEEEIDSMHDRPQQRGQVQGHGEKRRRWWGGGLPIVSGSSEDEVWMEFRSPPPPSTPVRQHVLLLQRENKYIFMSRCQ